MGRATCPEHVMNFSIHLDDRLAKELSLAARRTKRPRNALVAEAVRQWLERSGRKTWPPELTDFEPFTEVARFESHRSKRKTGPRFP
jgi:hypothetical protein